MQILVHDSRFTPRDSDRYPRFFFLRGWPRHRLSSGWRRTEAGFVHEPVAPVPNGPEPEDWLVYRHWDPVLNRYGPIRDHYAYNGGDLEADNMVPDLSLEARLAVSREVETISVRIRSGGDRFVVRIPVTGQGKLEVARNDQQRHVQPLANPLAHDRPVAARLFCSRPRWSIIGWPFPSTVSPSSCPWTTTIRRSVPPGTSHPLPWESGAER